MTDLYILLVWAIPFQPGDVPIEVIKQVGNQPLSFVECRMIRDHKLSFYYYLRNQDVVVLCPKAENAE